MKSTRLIAIVPTLNEEKGISLVIRELWAGGADEVIIVDGHSTDSTVTKAKRAGARVILQEGRGKGMAFKTFLKVYPIRSQDVYVMIDGDASYNGAEVVKFARGLENNEVIFGNRDIVITDLRSFVYTFGGLALSLAGSLLFLRYNRDICSGYIGFKGSALEKISLRSNTFTLEANLFTETVKKALSAGTVGVSYRKRAGSSKLTMFDGLKILLALLRERLT